jgi:DNA-binding GntR family transcriptional regulator
LEIFIKDHLTLTEKTVRAIEKAILDGSIKPGERIVETRMAKLLCVSKSPVREALKKLEGDGIVQSISRKGYIVKTITAKSIIELFDILTIIEPMAAKLALKKKGDAICTEIDRILAEMKKALSNKNYDSYLLLNEQFHGLFYDTVENEWITRISQMLRKQAGILRKLSLLSRDRLSESIKEHSSIAAAYQKGDAPLLAKAFRFHLQMFKKNILASDFLKSEEYLRPGQPLQALGKNNRVDKKLR